MLLKRQHAPFITARQSIAVAVFGHVNEVNETLFNLKINRLCIVESPVSIILLEQTSIGCEEYQLFILRST